MEVTDVALTRMIATVLPLLDERQRRTFAGARALWRGGFGVVARAAAISRSTVHNTVAKVDAGWIRRHGCGGRARAARG